MRVTPGRGQEHTVTIDEPTYLVEVWTPTRITSPAWNCEETGLSRCDVHEALAWAQEHTPHGGHHTLHACYVDDRGNGVMVRLAGHDPVHDGQSNRLTFTWRTG